MAESDEQDGVAAPTYEKRFYRRLHAHRNIASLA